MRIAFITLGCPKNLVDSEIMLGALEDAGHSFVAEPAQADVAVVNTCAFIAAATEESRGVIEQLIELKRSGGLRYVVVAGCLPQRYGGTTLDVFPDVDAVVGCHSPEDIADVVEAIRPGHPVYRVTTTAGGGAHVQRRILGTPSHLAYLRISEGCDNRCTYCTIPSIRGPLRSRDPEVIVAEARDLAALGVREINIIAQDTAAYGTDIASSVRLPELLDMLSEVGVPWLRVLYAHPAHVTDELVATIAGNDRVVRYLDLPIQHISDTILRAMGRRVTSARIESLLRSLRAAVPGITIRSTVIVGFPGEGEREFEELISFLGLGLIDYVGVFEFSPEEGTPAERLGPQVSRRIGTERAERVIEVMRGLARARGERMAGRTAAVLVDEEGDPAYGRLEGQAWELDGRVRIRSDGLPAGEFARVTIDGIDGFDLLATEDDAERV